MVNFLMKFLDRRSIFSEVEQIIKVTELTQSDKMTYVKGAAFEALQTAKVILTDTKSRGVKTPASVTGSNFSRKDFMEGESFSGGDCSPSSISPESRTSTLDFFNGRRPSEVGLDRGNGTEAVLVGKPFQKTKHKLVYGIFFCCSCNSNYFTLDQQSG